MPRSVGVVTGRRPWAVTRSGQTSKFESRRLSRCTTVRRRHLLPEAHSFPDDSALEELWCSSSPLPCARPVVVFGVDEVRFCHLDVALIARKR